MDAAVLAALLPALADGPGGRHADPEDQVQDGEQQADGEVGVMPVREGQGQGPGGESDPEQGRIHIEIGAEAAADAGDDFVGKTAVELALVSRLLPVIRPLFPVIRRLDRRISSLFLNLFRPPEDGDDGFDVLAGNDAFASAPFPQQFGHALLDPFQDLGTALAGAVVRFQLVEIFAGQAGGIVFEGKGETADADSFYFFHACLSVWIEETSSSQAVSIWASCSRPLSVRT